MDSSGGLPPGAIAAGRSWWGSVEDTVANARQAVADQAGADRAATDRAANEALAVAAAEAAIVPGGFGESFAASLTNRQASTRQRQAVRAEVDAIEAFLAERRGDLSAVPGTFIVLGQPISHRIDHMLSGTRANIAIKIFGDDLYELRRVAARVQAADLSTEQQTDIPQINALRGAFRGLGFMYELTFTQAARAAYLLAALLFVIVIAVLWVRRATGGGVAWSGPTTPSTVDGRDPWPPGHHAVSSSRAAPRTARHGSRSGDPGALA